MKKYIITEIENETDPDGNKITLLKEEGEKGLGSHICFMYGDWDKEQEEGKAVIKYRKMKCVKTYELIEETDYIGVSKKK